MISETTKQKQCRVAIITEAHTASGKIKVPLSLLTRMYYEGESIKTYLQAYADYHYKSKIVWSNRSYLSILHNS